MQVKPFTPFFTRAAIQFSGIPHKPKPPNIKVMLSLMSLMASSAFLTTLLIIVNYRGTKIGFFLVLRRDFIALHHLQSPHPQATCPFRISSNPAQYHQGG